MKFHKIVIVTAITAVLSSVSVLQLPRLQRPRKLIQRSRRITVSKNAEVK